MTAAPDLPAAACPDWCNVRHLPGNTHTGILGTADGTHVHVTRTDTGYGDPWDTPRVWACHRDAAQGLNGLLLEYPEALELAELTERLGHPELAGLLREAAGMCRAEQDAPG